MRNAIATVRPASHCVLMEPYFLHCCRLEGLCFARSESPDPGAAGFTAQLHKAKSKYGKLGR